MAYDSNLKSSRFLQGRRYTHNNLSDSQESFTSVLDLNSNEIYVDQGLIPSNNLPFNSSEDNLKTYVDPFKVKDGREKTEKEKQMRRKLRSGTI